MKKISYERRLQAFAMIGGLPALVVAGILIILSPWFLAQKLWIFSLLCVIWMVAGLSIHRIALAPLQVIANLLASLKEGDFSFRAKHQESDSALSTVYSELNILSDLLQNQRLKAIEVTALLHTVMSEIEVSIFAFDEEERLRLVNQSGESLLRMPSEKALGLKSSEIGLNSVLEGPSPRLVDLEFSGHTGRWELRRGVFRQSGRPCQLVVLSDLTRQLRDEEQVTWQRLIRVLSHEFNNSLAPIHSLAGSLLNQLAKKTESEELREDLRHGLEIIESRSESLRRFLDAYACLARLPKPALTNVDLASLVRRVVSLETRLLVQVEPGPALNLQADSDQLEQLLINLVRNAVEAMHEMVGTVRVSWASHGTFVEVRVEDDGPGLPPRSNLFVPFFTTKPGGSGIGLLLCRQIAENHRGTLSLENREGSCGACATLRIPISGAL